MAFVYLLQSDNGLYKIGKAVNVKRRVSEIATISSHVVTLIHTIETDDAGRAEKYWHERFAKKRIRGEWFALSGDEVAEMCRFSKATFKGKSFSTVEQLLARTRPDGEGWRIERASNGNRVSDYYIWRRTGTGGRRESKYAGAVRKAVTP